MTDRGSVVIRFFSKATSSCHLHPSSSVSSVFPWNPKANESFIGIQSWKLLLTWRLVTTSIVNHHRPRCLTHEGVTTWIFFGDRSGHVCACGTGPVFQKAVVGLLFVCLLLVFFLLWHTDVKLTEYISLCPNFLCEKNHSQAQLCLQKSPHRLSHFPQVCFHQKYPWLPASMLWSERLLLPELESHS